MTEPDPQDQRGYFMIPQAYEGGGYYVYGHPSKGRAQYAHPKLISTLLAVARQWSYRDSRKFGLGNISLANGAEFNPHKSHRGGLDADVRPLRKDGKRLPCSIFDKQYDRDATAALIDLFLKQARLQLILFNDKSIAGVRHAAGHSDHLHIQIAVAA